jgi:hypothetical protein
LEVDLVAEEPKYGTEKTQFYYIEKEEFVGSTSQGHRSTGRICIYPDFENAKLFQVL